MDKPLITIDERLCEYDIYQNAKSQEEATDLTKLPINKLGTSEFAKQHLNELKAYVVNTHGNADFFQMKYPESLFDNHERYLGLLDSMIKTEVK